MKNIDVKEKFLYYYGLGFSDTKISSIINTDRKKLGLLRKELNLPRANSISIHLDKVKELCSMGYNDSLIGKILKIKAKRVNYIRTFYNIPAGHIERVYEDKTLRRKGYIIRNIKFSAKRRNLEFNLNYTDLQLPKYCPILNIPLNYSNSSQNFDHATVDRIDNTKGYIKGNVIVMSRLANSMKNQASFDQLKIFNKNINKIILHYENQGALGNITDVFPNIEMYKET